MQAELDATKSAAASDVSALKESFEHQKTQFREKLEDSTKQIDHLQKPGLLFGTNSIKIPNNQSKFPEILQNFYHCTTKMSWPIELSLANFLGMGDFWKTHPIADFQAHQK